ncbi:MAG: hypothetical protein R6U63_10260 [Longimicrobiales bacterium]
MGGTGESTLRAKYLDWCSARLAERFLDLSPEEIYALARPAEPDRAEPDRVEPAGPGEADGASESPEADRPFAEPTRSGTPAPASELPMTGDASPADASTADDSRSETSPADASSADAPSPGEGPSSAPPRLPRPTDEGYRTLVQRVTEALLRRTSLPTFEQWAEAYAEDPDRFEAELLGFWKDVVGED